MDQKHFVVVVLCVGTSVVRNGKPTAAAAGAEALLVANRKSKYTHSTQTMEERNRR